jgi:hypothetical protein
MSSDELIRQIILLESRLKAQKVAVVVTTLKILTGSNSRPYAFREVGQGMGGICGCNINEIQIDLFRKYTHLAKLPESDDNLTNSVSRPSEVNGFYTAFTSEKLRLQGDLSSEGVCLTSYLWADVITSAPALLFM